MKIPESVRIGGQEYAVVYEPVLVDDGKELCGQIRYMKGEIALSEGCDMGHDAQCQTLLHEILHGIARFFNAEIEDEETVIDMFAKGLYQVLQDNESRLFDLKEVRHEDR